MIAFNPHLLFYYNFSVMGERSAC